MKKFFILLFCLFSLPAFASDQLEPNDLGVTDKDCQAMSVYKPSADLDYKPGVDVHGKPVVEADLAPSVIRMPEAYVFELTVDTARYMGLSVPEGLEGKASFGTVTVDKGQVWLNGNSLDGEALAALRAICAAKKTPEAPKKPPQ